MRILCDNCSAKYSIADEKVMGKVFKIRCKKCSHVILVRGDGASGPGEAASAAPSSSAGGVWYVVRAGQQDGPYTESDIQGLLSSGEIQGDTYTWREGFADWIPLTSVDELRHLVGGGASVAPVVASAPAEPAPAPAPSQDEFGADEATRVVSGHSYDPAPAAAPMAAAAGPGEATEAMDVASFQARNPDPVAADPAPTEAISASAAMAAAASAPVAAAPSMETGLGAAAAASAAEPGGIFASFDPPSQGPGIGFDPSASFDGGLEAVVPQVSKPAPAKQNNGMVGARNENSVLFSLNNLSEAASSDGEAEAPANSEASGLIDIRALSASAAAVSGGRDGAPANGAADPFAAPAAGPAIQVPAMMPMGTRKSNAPLFVAIGGGLLVLLLVGAALVAVLVWRSGEPDPIIKERPDAVAAAGNPGGNGAAAAGGGEGDKAGDPAAPAAGGDAEKKDDAVAEAPKDGEAKDGEAKDGATPDGEAKDGEAKDGEAKDGDAIAAKGDKAADPSGDEKAAPEKPKTAEERRKEKERREELAEKRRKEKELAALTKKDPPKEDKKDDKKADKKGKGGDSIDDIIGGIGKKPKDKKDPPKEAKPKETPKEAPAAKASLSKSDVLKVIRRSYGRVSACSKNQGANPVKGTVTIRFTITSSGSVASAKVTTGKFKGTAVGGCITRVVRGMKFPKSGSSLTINYPFPIK